MKCSVWGYFHEPRFLEFLDYRLISLGAPRKLAENKMPVNQNWKRIEVTKCPSTNVFDTSAIVS